jgi:hypothetical protein
MFNKNEIFKDFDKKYLFNINWEPYVDPNKPDVQDLVRCKRNGCGCIRKNNSGNSNSLNHTLSHSNWKEHYHESKCAIRTGPIDVHVTQASPEAKKIHGWIRWIVQQNQPFSVVDNEETRKFSKWEPICKKSLVKYMNLLLDNVLASLKSILPKYVGIIFDG